MNASDIDGDDIGDMPPIPADDGPSTLEIIQEVRIRRRSGVVVERAPGIKCARSWRYFDPASADPDFPDITPRDAVAMREWRAANPESA